MLKNTHKPVLIEEGYNNFNIIAFEGLFYGLAQGEGAFDIAKFKNNHYQAGFEGTSVEQVRLLIDQNCSDRTIK